LVILLTLKDIRKDKLLLTIDVSELMEAPLANGIPQTQVNVVLMESLVVIPPIPVHRLRLWYLTLFNSLLQTRPMLIYIRSVKRQQDDRAILKPIDAA